MIGGIFIQSKVYNRFDYTSVLLMTIGLVFFTLGGQKVSPNFDATGIALITMALASDAIIGNIQEKTMKAYKASNCEVVLYSYSIGFLYIFVGEVTTGVFFEANRKLILNFLPPLLLSCNERKSISKKKLLQRESQSIRTYLLVLVCWLHGHFVRLVNGEVVWRTARRHGHHLPQGVVNYYFVHLFHQTIHNSICLVRAHCSARHFVEHLQVSSIQT